MKPNSLPIPTNRLLLTCLLVGGAACQSPGTSQPQQPPDSKPAAPIAAPALVEPAPPIVIAPAPIAIGMQDPFKLMNTAAAKTLNDAWRAVHGKQPSLARAAFHEVVTAYPDKTAARFAELKMAVKEGDLASTPALWRELLARDYVSYAPRLDADKELTVLRKSSQGPALRAITKEMKAAYAADLDQGIFFVARIHPYAGPAMADDADVTKLSPDQEAYHLDPITRRIRRLSNTGGQVLAIHADTDRRQLMMVLAGALEKREGKAVFAQSSAVVLSLESLESVGPLPIPGSPASVALCFSSKGEPIWAPVRIGAGDDPALTLDATGTGLVASDEACGKSVATTEVRPGGVEHFPATVANIALSEDGLQLTGVDEDVPVRSTQAIRPGSFSWSPGKKRFVYTGSVSRCDVAAVSNALYVWDPARKRSARISAAPSSYEAQWIDDDHLAYQFGLDRVTKLTVHDFRPGAEPVTIDTPAGAGLYGVPVLGCAQAELHALLR
jgi:hypothetical protein